MCISYERFRELLINRDVTRIDLRFAVARCLYLFKIIKKNKYILFDLMNKICKAIDCNSGDIMDYVPYDSAKGLTK